MATEIPVYIITDPSFQRHDTGGGDHPEVPERMQVIARFLRSCSFTKAIQHYFPIPATRSQLLTFHTEDWLFRFEEAVLSGRTYIDHPDNQVGYESYEIATLSAGTGIRGVDLIEQDSQSIIFGITRPPGHHAEPNTPYGFCFFNNCVIAARYWQNGYGRKRICILDFDAHHGNGIQTAFEEDADSAYISIHEHPSFSYPGTGWPEETGIKAGKGTMLNLPLLPGAGDSEVRALFPRILDFVKKFQPDALVVGAGFDAHIDDDMSGLNFSTRIYEELGAFIAELAHTYTQDRFVSILEGGYFLESLGPCVGAYLQGIILYKNKK
ncbi:histone deacetylase family protein [Desulfogranum japonicum]|uniref:histone deacetylase family protein n=1 Tax=Desulfogranum japonicum TaxID=231447 RepID=UPI0004058C39|nr:histone deacetylase [Desulfogranum japonicum]